MIALYILEREREQAQVAWDGRWRRESHRMRRADKLARRAPPGPVSRLRVLFSGAGR